MRNCTNNVDREREKERNDRVLESDGGAGGWVFVERSLKEVVAAPFIATLELP